MFDNVTRHFSRRGADKVEVYVTSHTMEDTYDDKIEPIQNESEDNIDNYDIFGEDPAINDVITDDDIIASDDINDLPDDAFEDEDVIDSNADDNFLKAHPEGKVENDSDFQEI